MSLGNCANKQRFAAMIWYVAIIAIVNLGLGYALALMLGRGRGRVVLVSGHDEAGEPDNF
jgi:hypothetical protein